MNIYNSFCQDEKCPVCGGEILDMGSIVRKKRCNNQCFALEEYEQLDLSDNYYFYFFWEKFITINSKDSESDKILKIKLVHDKIKYWKENDRYLTKIMGV